MEAVELKSINKRLFIKWFLIIIFLIILIGIIVILYLPSKVCFNNQCFRVETAITPEQRAKGLMFRQSLDQDKGMLFVYPESGEYSFWMKDTYIPLDIIWIDEDQTIAYINENSQPCQGDCLNINPSVQAKYVLEINARMIDSVGLKVGDKLTFKGIGLKNLFVK